MCVPPPQHLDVLLMRWPPEGAPLRPGLKDPPTPGHSVVQRTDVMSKMRTGWTQLWGTGGPVHGINGFFWQELQPHEVQSRTGRNPGPALGLISVPKGRQAGSRWLPLPPHPLPHQVALLPRGRCPPTASPTSPDVLAWLLVAPPCSGPHADTHKPC